MIDLDGLKGINDAHGHRIGDAAIVEAARRIALHARASDTIARLGGDEFGILLVSANDRNQARLVASRISERCAEPFAFESLTLRMGASIGAALFPDDADTLEALLEVADHAMYAEKRERKRRAE